MCHINMQVGNGVYSTPVAFTEKLRLRALESHTNQIRVTVTYTGKYISNSWEAYSLDAYGETRWSKASRAPCGLFVCCRNCLSRTG
jgi:hypothetical protein